MNDDKKYISVVYPGKQIARKRAHAWMKRLVWTLIISIYAYVGIVLWYTYLGIPVPDSLTYVFIPGILGQLGITGAITRKTKETEKEIDIANIVHSQSNDNIL